MSAIGSCGSSMSPQKNTVSPLHSKNYKPGFPGGAVVKNPPANAGDTGSSPGPGISYMPWSNYLCTTTTEPAL